MPEPGLILIDAGLVFLHPAIGGVDFKSAMPTL